jgi:choline dehydrogenase-like flavoprotein
LLRTNNIRVVLHANASTIELEPAGTRVSRVICATLNGKKFEVAGRIFVLAMGGLENPRLLLNSRNVHPRGIANSDDLVGRFFMEHIYSYPASVTSIPASFPPDYLRLNYETFQKNLGPTPALGLPEAVMRRQQLPNAAAFFVRRPIHKTDDRFYSRRMQGFIALVEMLEHRRAPSRRVVQHVWHSITNTGTVVGLVGKAIRGKLIKLSQYAVHIQAEPVPNRESRVMLADSKDALGVNQISVDWRLSPQDLDGVQRFEESMVSRLEMYGVATRRIKHDRDSEGWPVFMPSSKHHMGTTRMSEDPHLGVVDKDCRVHGIRNLFVTGSSVFPTAGMANPTLTIVALAVRLAGHISRVLG